MSQSNQPLGFVPEEATDTDTMMVVAGPIAVEDTDEGESPIIHDEGHPSNLLGPSTTGSKTCDASGLQLVSPQQQMYSFSPTTGLSDPGQHGIFNEQQTHFCKVHDVLTHMMRYLSAEEQLVLRRVNHTWQTAVDDLGSSKYTTQRVTRLVQDYNKAVRKEHEPKVRAHLYSFLLGTLTGLILFIFVATQYHFRDTTSTALVIISIICTPEIGLAGAIAAFIYFRRDRLGHALVLSSSLILLTALVSSSTWFGGKYYTGDLYQSSTIGVAECLFLDRSSSSSSSTQTGVTGGNASAVFSSSTSSPSSRSSPGHVYYDQILVLYPALWSEECIFTTVSSTTTTPSQSDDEYQYSLVRVKGIHADMLAASIDCEEATRDPLGYGTYYSLKVKSNESSSGGLLEVAKGIALTTNSSVVLSDDAAMDQVIGDNRFVLSGYAGPKASSSWGAVLSERKSMTGAPVPTLFQAVRDHLFWGTVDNHLVEKEFYKAKVWTEGQVPLVSTTIGEVDPGSAYVTFLCLVFAALIVWSQIVLVTTVRLIRRFIFFRSQLFTYPHERAICKRPLTRRDAFLMIRRAQKNEEEAIERAEERAAQLRARLRKAGLLQHSSSMGSTASSIVPHPGQGPTTMPPLAARAPGGTVASMALGAAATATSTTAGGVPRDPFGDGLSVFGSGRRQRIPGGRCGTQLHASTPFSRGGTDSPDSGGGEPSVYAARDRVAGALSLTPTRNEQGTTTSGDGFGTPEGYDHHQNGTPSTPYGFDMNDKDVAAYLQPSSTSGHASGMMARENSNNYSFAE